MNLDADSREAAARATLEMLAEAGLVATTNEEATETGVAILAACFAEYERDVLYAIAMGRQDAGEEPTPTSSRRFTVGDDGAVSFTSQ